MRRLRKIRNGIINFRMNFKRFIKANIKDTMLTVAFLIIFVNTLFLNVHIAFYLLALFIIIMALF
ncbi:hypothetical protein [Clostridium tetani]|uniref:hypothetical protein n=1 Tax=Clostridium tetani TaxID=1513 RepID=UPI000B2BD965|nr:hypothetical protein [Clostridium tetani]BDR75767.1 hypothetical protein K154306013_14270 [Clostridium tetani]BDR86883.1 hypothetical protein N071400001_14910 [Clostridium tetani]